MLARTVLDKKTRKGQKWLSPPPLVLQPAAHFDLNYLRAVGDDEAAVPIGSPIPSACVAALENCLRRVNFWRVPPNWSCHEWHSEIKAHGLAASYQALHDYDPRLGIPLGGFLYRRIMARVLTRHRQEWRYAIRSILLTEKTDRLDCEPDNAHTFSTTFTALRDAVASLAKRDRTLIANLFLEGKSEKNIAKALGIGQRAVNKRKHAALGALRRRLVLEARDLFVVPKPAPRSITIIKNSPIEIPHMPKRHKISVENGEDGLTFRIVGPAVAKANTKLLTSCLNALVTCAENNRCFEKGFSIACLGAIAKHDTDGKCVSKAFGFAR